MNHKITINGVSHYYRIDGNPYGAPIVFVHALGTHMAIWDDVVSLLPKDYKIIRYDIRGHGQTGCPAAPYSMGQLVRDAELLLETLKIHDCVFVGLSLGGMIAQGLAIKRLDLIRALVLSNTAAKIGQPEMWRKRISAVTTNGIKAISDDTLSRWFAPKFRATPKYDTIRSMLLSTHINGYTGCCAAISGCDFYTPTSGLRLATLGIAGDRDGSTPPDLVRETIDLIPGAQFELIHGAGHLPCVDAPQNYVKAIKTFLTKVGH